MPIRTAPDTPRYDASVQKSVKNVHDRDPLLIPQLFAEPVPPWYRRRSAILLGVVALLGVAVVTVALQRYGISGTAQRAARVGASVLRTFARVVG
jgi:hypothetical protein